MVPLFTILVQSDLEHEQISISKLLLVILKWKYDNETPLLSVVLSVLLIHPSMGAAVVDSLSSIAVMDPKLGVPLLLAIMFYSNIFTSNDIICHDMLVSQLEKSILDFKKMNLELFFFETSPTSMTSIADKAIPRAVENIALAIGALCGLSFKDMQRKESFCRR
ncbi:hypothetical protein P8452_56136 [Trifolium repens]|nr:hypothetical protein P8452_56136 [Trifolium repens]